MEKKFSLTLVRTVVTTQDIVTPDVRAHAFTLPCRQQERIASVVEALIAQAGNS